MRDIQESIKIVFVMLFLCLIVTAWHIVSSAEILARVQVFTPKDSPYNKSFAGWAIEWWNHQTSLMPAESHPRDHYTPERCILFQGNNTGPVWFLPDGTNRFDNSVPEVRECEVPAGKALLVQLVGSGCSEGEGFMTDEERYSCAVWILDPKDDKVSFKASVDGVEVLNTAKNPGDMQRIYLEPVRGNLTYVENSPYTTSTREPVIPGTYPAVVGGYFLFLPPLSPGEHIVDIEEKAIGADIVQDPTNFRSSNVQYKLSVS